MLQYSLRRLRQKVEVDATSLPAQRLEAAAESRRGAGARRVEQLAQLTPETSTSSGTIPVAPSGPASCPAAPVYPQVAPTIAMDDLIFHEDWWWDMNAVGPGLNFGDITGETAGVGYLGY